MTVLHLNDGRDLFGTLLARLRLRGGRTVTRAESIAALAAAFTSNGIPAEKVAIYLQALADVDPADLQAAVSHIIETQQESWFPTIAALRAIIFEQQLALPSPEHAWELIQNETYRANAPAAVRDALKAIGGTWTLRNSPVGVVRTQFIQQYKDARKRAVETASSTSRGQLGPAAVTRELGPGPGRDAAA